MKQDIECNCGDTCPSVKKQKTLRDVFKSCASCACAGGGAFVAGHAGCIASFALIATGLSIGGLGLSIAFGAVATAGGLLLWNKLRGKNAPPLEKKIVYGGAVLGLALSIMTHFNRAHDHGKNAHPLDGKNIISCPAPTP